MTSGIDTNILCYALDGAFPEHKRAAELLRELSPEKPLAINPTVLHECYHTLVYAQRWLREDARTRLVSVVKNPNVSFFNQTKSISVVALSLAEKYTLGGRDSVILANFLTNRASEVLTHDSDLLDLKEVSWRGRKMMIRDPLEGARAAGR